MTAALPGLPKGKVVLAEPHADWPALFAAEAARLRSALGEQVLGLEHYGSTAIPGIKAKPVIDLLVGLDRLETAAGCAPAMLALGYEDAGTDVVPDHHIFGLGEARTHIVHMVAFEGQAWRECLAFRDALRADPALARAYEALKVDLGAQFADDRAAYTDGKGAFVTEIVTRALSRG